MRPALVEVHAGIAIGAGTDVAIESADIVLVRSDPGDVASILVLARATHRNAALVSLSTVIVAINARLLSRASDEVTIAGVLPTGGAPLSFRDR